jgi:glutathione S-transferase
MKLYFSPGACSLSPHIVLREADLSSDLEAVDLKSKKTKGGADYTGINPKGQVPALMLDDGELLTEGPAIVQYLADRAPRSGLAPQAGTLERVRLQEWLNFISTELHKSFGPLFNPATPDDYKPIAKDTIGKRFAFVDQHLAKSGPFLLGGKFSVADAYLFVMTFWANYLKIDLSTWPHLKAYSERVAARPHVREAMQEEGLAK